VLSSDSASDMIDQLLAYQGGCGCGLPNVMAVPCCARMNLPMQLTVALDISLRCAGLRLLCSPTVFD
jgi:hypothetical protein